MRPGEEFRRLCVYLNDNDQVEGRPLYEAIVQKAHTLGLAGASVFKGEIGYGTRRVVHDTQSEYSFVGAPVVVEVVDRAEPIQALLRELGDTMSQRCVTVSSVRVIAREHPAAE